MWINFNPNPTGRKVGDCAIRAVSKALGISWESAYQLVADAGYIMDDLPQDKQREVQKFIRKMEM